MMLIILKDFSCESQLKYAEDRRAVTFIFCYNHFMPKAKISPLMFRGKLKFLSNFWEDPFWMPELEQIVATSEHAFNALKTVQPSMQAWVLSAEGAREAKVRGRRVPLQTGWDEGLRDEVMTKVLAQKFTLPHLKIKLIETRDLHLIETNFWHDQYWGDCLCSKHADVPGENMLGKMLMELRNSIN